ncbi:MAG: SRPBCC family protein [Pseudomonadota bacterium]
MKSETQVALINELLDLQQSKSPFLDDHWQQETLDRYLSSDIFAREQALIGRRLPQIVAHVSEIDKPGDFITTELAGRPLLLIRDEDGNARAFYNVCRHRGAQLVGESSGCQHRLRCPYHAWTWNSAGQLIGVPHEKTGFPGLDRSEFGLHALPCEEFGGWLWVSLASEEPIDVSAHLGELAGDILAMDAGRYRIFDTTIKDIDANWKILVEGGLEAYHFRVAHKETIAPLFLDNLSSYQCFDRHIRSVLPRSSLTELESSSAEEWDFAKHANVLYTLFPGSQFLVQEDHFVWIQGKPIAPDRTQLQLSTVIPAEANTPEQHSYWRRNHELTMYTLDEDFVLGESIQRGLASGANTHLNFGRFEGALARFNEFVDQAIEA